MSIEIRPGEKVGIVGRVGSGKSSLIKVLAGLIEPSEGHAQVDQINISQIRPVDFRLNVGVSLQEPVLFSGSIKENFLFGKPDATDEEIFSASKITGFDQVVNGLHGGFAAILNEGEISCQGGKDKHFALARTFLNNPKVMLLGRQQALWILKLRCILLATLKTGPKIRLWLLPLTNPVCLKLSIE